MSEAAPAGAAVAQLRGAAVGASSRDGGVVVPAAVDVDGPQRKDGMVADGGTTTAARDGGVDVPAAMNAGASATDTAVGGQFAALADNDDEVEMQVEMQDGDARAAELARRAAEHAGEGPGADGDAEMPSPDERGAKRDKGGASLTPWPPR